MANAKKEEITPEQKAVLTSESALKTVLAKQLLQAKADHLNAHLAVYEIAKAVRDLLMSDYMLGRNSAILSPAIDLGPNFMSRLYRLAKYDTSKGAEKVSYFETRLRRGAERGFRVFYSEMETYRENQDDVVLAFDDDANPVWLKNEDGTIKVRKVIGKDGQEIAEQIQAVVPYVAQKPIASFDDEPSLINPATGEPIKKKNKNVPNKSYGYVLLPECVMVKTKKNKSGVESTNIDETPTKATDRAFSEEFTDSFPTARLTRSPKTPGSKTSDTPQSLSDAEKTAHALSAVNNLTALIHGRLTGDSKNWKAYSPEQLELFQACLNCVVAGSATEDRQEFEAFKQFIGETINEAYGNQTDDRDEELAEVA